MIKKIFIHMGMYHTGTTSMQNVLAKNPAELKDAGIYFYLAMPLTYTLHNECNKKVFLYDNRAAEDIVSDLIEKAENYGANTLVLSHEGISYNPYYRNMTHNLGNTNLECKSIAHYIRKRLYNLFKEFDVKIVFYPRRQDHWVVSNYCNAIYKNNLYSITKETIQNVADPCLAYATLMDAWANFFGEDSIIIRPYEKKQLPYGTLYDFCKNILNCRVPKNYENYKANITPGKDTIYLLQKLNQLITDENINNLIINEIKGKRDSYFLMDYLERLSILQSYFDENRRCAQKYLKRQDGILFYEEWPNAEKYPDINLIFSNKIKKQLHNHLISNLEDKYFYLDADILNTALELPIKKETDFIHAELLYPDDSPSSDKPDFIVRYPKKFINEKKYTIKTLFCNILAYTVLAIPCDSEEYVILTMHGKEIMHITDIFFRNSDENKWPYTYAHPQPLTVFKDGDSKENLSVFYGEPDFFWEDNVAKCRFDIIGMSFYALSRIEELFSTSRDMFDRYLPSESEHRIFKNPVINEWANFCQKILFNANINKKKSLKFFLHMTHDIDHLNHNEKEIFWLANEDKYYSIKSSFYFMGYGTNNKYDDNYFCENTDYMKYSIKKITQIGHSIGFHPGFDSYINKLVWKMQKNSLQDLCEFPLTEGRQHYLRYKLPFTWRIFEENGFTLDTGLSLANKLGYRAGTGSIFSAYDVISRRSMNLKILPLICMDAMMTYMNCTYEIFFEQIKEYINKAKKYNMPICLLFHNSFFSGKHITLRKNMYRKILEMCG